MGFLEFILKFQPRSRAASVQILGLNNSGKTSILRQLTDDDTATVTPTQGFQIKTIEVGGVRLNMWDVSGQRAVRFYWRQYFGEADAIIFVVDAADPHRMSEAGENLGHVLEEEKLAGVPLLAFANKQDLIGAQPPDEVCEKLGLSHLRDRRWHMQGCSAKTGEGLQDGITWMLRQIRR